MELDKRRINVRAIIWRNGTLLAVKHKSENGEEAPYWALPGGGLDPLESLEDGIARELMEEFGVQAQVGRMLFGQQFPSSRPDRDEELEFFYLITNPEDFMSIDLKTTSHGSIELARVEFVDPREVNILPTLLQTIDIAKYADSVQPVYIANNLREKSV